MYCTHYISSVLICICTINKDYYNCVLTIFGNSLYALYSHNVDTVSLYSPLKLYLIILWMLDFKYILLFYFFYFFLLLYIITNRTSFVNIVIDTNHSLKYNVDNTYSQS